jgi:NAD(P)-dependent dehydrogenase (short-subunit alcohol dehydrogenase family)
VPPDFRGKIALVTGVGRVGQIGHAVARGFAEAGAQLVIADVNAAGLAERAKELSAAGHDVRVAAGDLATPDAARRAVSVAREQLGGLDVLVNVAGGLVNYGSALELQPEQFERELTINVKTTFYMSQAAIPALVARGGGAIVNFASVAVLKPQAQMASYIAAKSAVAGLTRALAREFADAGVRVNAVAPGTMRTADNVAQMKDAKVRWVELADLVRAVLYLASDEARAVSGEILAVTGGDS